MVAVKVCSLVEWMVNWWAVEKVAMWDWWVQRLVDKMVEKMERMWVVWKVELLVKKKAVWRAWKMVVD